MRIKTTFRE